MNTRKYPRTLNEAFPTGPEYGCAVTSFARDPMANLAIKVVIAALVVPTIVSALMGWI